MAGQRGHALVELGVVLHRAGAERVEAGVEVEVALRQPVVVADDLGLGDLGELRRLGSAQLGRQQLVQRPLGHVEGRRHERPTSRLGALVDREPIVGGADHARTSLPARSAAMADPSAVDQPVDVGPGPLLGDRHQQAVAELRVVTCQRVAGVDALLAAAGDHLVHGRVECDRELAHDGLPVEQRNAVEPPRSAARA